MDDDDYLQHALEAWRLHLDWPLPPRFNGRDMFQLWADPNFCHFMGRLHDLQYPSVDPWDDEPNGTAATTDEAQTQNQADHPDDLFNSQ